MKIVILILLMMPAAMAQTFEADNGAKFKIISVEPIGSMTDRTKNNALALISDNDDQAHQIAFDCEGHYSPLTSREGWRRLAPRGVLAAIGRTACKRIGR